MAEEIGIVMSLYDKVSPNLKSIAKNAEAFDKTLDELEQSLKSYEKAQSSLVGKSADLKKSMAEVDLKVREAGKGFRKLKDDTSKGVLDAAIDEQAKLRQELTATEQAIKDNNDAYKALYKSARDAAVEVSKAENRMGGNSGPGALDGGIKGLSKGLMASGLLRELGSSLSGAAGAILTSAIGQPQAELASQALGGAMNGAAAGAMLGPLGALIGAGFGGIAGAFSGGTQIFQAKDDAFKGYVQEAVEGVNTRRETDISSGSAVAGQRELDAIAFNKLLGDGVGDQYLSDLRAMAAATPMEYGDLTGMSRALATGFGGDPERMLALMQGLGDAGSAVGLGASDMTEMARAMSRMQSSGKASLEFLNIFQDRGVDVIGMLSNSLGKSQGQIYDMISRGQIGGQSAADIIQAGLESDTYRGAMDEMSQTFSGLSSTLADAKTEMQAAYGEGYNTERSKGIAAETEWLSGMSGERQQEANQAMGAWKAALENEKEELVRNAVDNAMNSNAYRQAQASGDAAKMGEIIERARIQGMNAYNASEGAQLELESQKSLIQAVRDDSALNMEYWSTGYVLGQELSRGLAAAISFNNQDTFIPGDISFNADLGTGSASANAYGLRRVPYNNYAALLHQGERVLTAQEARRADAGGGGSVQVSVTGNEFTVRNENDLDAIGQAIASAMERKLYAGVVS